MNFTIRHRFRYRVILASLFFLLHGATWAQVNTTGFYLAPQITYMTLEADFDGQSGFAGVGEAAGNYVYVPKVDSTIGHGIVVGSRLDQFALELGVLISDHDASIFGYDTSVRYRIYNIDFKHFYRPGEQVQPYAGIGAGYHSIKVKDGAATDSKYGEGEMHSWGLNLPFGIVAHLSNHVSLNAGIVFRFVEFGSMETLNGTMHSQGSEIDGTGYYLNAGLSYKF